MDVQTILVPLDASTCSQLVVAEATSLAEKLEARMVLLHVSARPAGLSRGTSVHPDGTDVSADQYLHDAGMVELSPFLRVPKGRGVAAEALVRSGPIADTIGAVGSEVGADLIVMGTHGRTGLARAVLGSVAEQVVRAATVPVMLIRRQRRPECAHASCSWCTEGAMFDSEEAIQAEADG
jgi:nucleotide-binding universal stress UspA family protein